MKYKKAKYHIILALLLVLLGLGLCLIEGSYAAYSNEGFQRGVVRNRDSEEIRCTSNILKPYVSTGEQKNYETVLYPFAENTEENERLTIPLTIANYLMNNDNLVNERDITFDLTIQLKDKQSGSSYTLNGEEKADEVIEINDVKLTGRKQSHVEYKIGFTGKDLDKLTIVVEAVPHNYGDKILAAYICPCTNSQVNPFSYSGGFLNKNVGNPQDYKGFNYEVSISSGRGKVTLSWDTNYVKLDPFFLEKLDNRINMNIEDDKKYIYDQEEGSIQFLMDQTMGEDDYVILFYPIQQLHGITWDKMEKDVISLKVEEIGIGN